MVPGGAQLEEGVEGEGCVLVAGLEAPLRHPSLLRRSAQRLGC